MRLTDYLLTETPRPALGDKPFTGFADLYPDPTVIDYTDAHSLWMQMTMFDEPEFEYSHADGVLGEGTAWQVMQFLNFDFSTIGVVAPPFENFVMEADVRESMEIVGREMGIKFSSNQFLNVGRTACAFTAIDRERWLDDIYRERHTLLRNALHGTDMRTINALPFRWIYMVTTYLYFPGKGMMGPTSTWAIPVDQDGKLFTNSDPHPDNQHLVHALCLGPLPPGDDADAKSFSDAYAIQQGWAVLLPSLLALSFMHTPRTTKKAEGYHDVHEGEMPGSKVQRKYLERNFRPMTRWSRLDIRPLREAIRSANGGTMPTSIDALKKALHVVRGHSRTYMPNTYFGRKHDRPITVFIPSFRRGDARAGVVQKEYTLNG